MRDLLTKKLKSDGFTLAELLIVVAIIAVLAVIAIPIFALKVESSKEETDIANLRAAKSAATAQFLLGEDLNEPALTITAEGFECYFDAAGGVLKSSSDGIEPYGQGTESAGSCEEFAMVTNPDEDHPQTYYKDGDNVAGGVIKIYINGNGTIELSWVDTANGDAEIVKSSASVDDTNDATKTVKPFSEMTDSEKKLLANKVRYEIFYLKTDTTKYSDAEKTNLLKEFGYPSDYTMPEELVPFVTNFTPSSSDNAQQINTSTGDVRFAGIFMCLYLDGAVLQPKITTRNGAAYVPQGTYIKTYIKDGDDWTSYHFDHSTVEYNVYDQWYAYSDVISPEQFHAPIKMELYSKDGTLLQTFTYSVNTYIYNNIGKSSGDLYSKLLYLYNYGLEAKAQASKN